MTRTSSGILELTVEQQKELFNKLLSDKMKSEERSKRLRVKNQLLLIKAKEMGLEVSNEEVNDYIQNMK